MKNIKLNVITVYKSFLHRMHDDCKRLCDFCFPDNSTRRILLKNTIWVFKHFKTASLLLNRYNLQKALLCYKMGGLRELLSRVNGKFHSSSVASLHDLVIEYANLWLQDTKNIIPLWITDSPTMSHRRTAIFLKTTGYITIWWKHSRFSAL